MANLRQSILLRTDLNFPIGLLAAQVAHIHAGVLIDNVLDNDPSNELREWARDPYLFVHQVPNLEVLEYFERGLDDKGMTHHVWRDTVYIDISPTQQMTFEDVKVGLSIGPADSDDIKVVIGDLPLL